jgi:hypothetical protein
MNLECCRVNMKIAFLTAFYLEIIAFISMTYGYTSVDELWINQVKRVLFWRGGFIQAPFVRSSS